jgi:hypothetical protein
MSTPRRDFLQFLGAGGVFAATGMPHRFLVDSGATPKPITDKWDMSWCDRVTGQVRAVFDSPDPAEGAALFRAQLWRDEHKEVYGTEAAQASAVVVIRHEAIPLVMNDAFWQRFEIGKDLKLKDAKGKKWAVANPIATTAPGMPARYANYNVPAFQASGGIILACNLAFGGMVQKFKDKDKLSAADARTQAVAHLLPGVILQPSGIFAVQRAQQAGCNYIFAS